jgi:hypothetical protein
MTLAPALIFLARRVGAGLLTGAAAGAFCAASVSTLFFAAGLYSSVMLTLGTVLGLLAGLLAGPIIGLRRTGALRAAIGSAAIGTVLFLAYQAWILSGRAVFSTPEAALQATIIGAAWVALSAGGTGVGAAVLSARIERDERGRPIQRE